MKDKPVTDITVLSVIRSTNKGKYLKVLPIRVSKENPACYIHTQVITMDDSIAENNFAKNKSKIKYNLKLIGKYWFLEIDGKLKRLKFLNDISNVRMDENVIFADESVYQVETDDDNTVKIIKIEDLYQGRSNLKPEDYDAGRDINEEPLKVKLSDTGTEGELDIGSIDIGSKSDSRNIRDSVVDASLYPDCTNEIEEMGQEEYESEEDENDKDEQLEIGSDEYMHLPNKIIKPIIVIALGEFRARLDDEISFMKDEKLTVDEDILRQGHTWIPATHQASGQTGFIPRRFIRKDDNSPMSQEPWWFNLNKEDTYEVLMSPCYKPGTFLIRNSSDKVSFALSVKTYVPQTLRFTVSHYKIKRSDHGQFFINITKQFANIPDLISFYKKSANGLCCKLEEQCKLVKPTLEVRDLETAMHSVTILKALYNIPDIGKVHIGKWRGKEVAIKSQKSGQTIITEFKTEINILCHLQHDKVVKLIAIHTETEPFLVISELLINGPLLHYLHKDGGNTVRFGDLTNIASQIAEGMAYLEEMHIVHRDLRAFNILVGRNNEVKIAGFGLARRIQKESGIYRETSGKYPLRWTSPEAIFESRFSNKSDVWSFGIVLYEIIMFGGMPYQGMTGKEAVERIRYGFRMPIPGTAPLTCPEPYYEMMLRCWDRVADRRPSFDYLRDYFKDYDSNVQTVYNTRL